METIMDVTEARKKLGEIVKSVQHQRDTYILSHDGEPAAAIVPLHVYDAWKERQRKLFDLIDKFQVASGEADPDEVMRDVLEAQQAVRMK